MPDSLLTVGAVSVLAHMVGTALHEGLGRACVALLTVARSGIVSTVAWSGATDGRLVEAGGTLPLFAHCRTSLFRGGASHSPAERSPGS